MIKLNQECKTCNRVKISIGDIHPVHEVTIVEVVPKDKSFPYRAKFDDDDLIYMIRAEYIRDIILCPIEEENKNNSKSIERWLKST